MTHSTHQRINSTLSGLGVIIMAAGLGKRMKSAVAKVLHPVAGRPMVLYIVDMAGRLADHGVAVVVGYQGADVRKVGRSCGYGNSGCRRANAAVRNGTCRAASPSCIRGPAQRKPSRYLILNGDTPLLSEGTVRELLAMHDTQSAAVTLLTAVLDDASGYGRVLRRQEEWLREPLTTPCRRSSKIKMRFRGERRVREINVGTYVVEGDFIFPALDKLDPRNAQGEYYLTDIVQMAVRAGLRVSAVPPA